jgi:hypothetical protein
VAQALPVYKFDDKYAGDTDGFTFDLAAWLGDDDQISALPTATVTPSGPTVASVIWSDALVTVWISGGTAPQAYTVELHVVTTGGRDCRVRGTFAVDA